MQEIMNKIGINTELLQSEPLHTREQTLEILGVSPKTLWNYQKSNLIEGTTFKGKRYYSKDAIIDCIKIHFNITTSTEFDSMWE
jgi:hypothetical protein|tara:strand:- start:180 stop:431 length:252 start_codon:yes stop_codon:yes gene_type:complete